jgi:hypothetical protein
MVKPVTVSAQLSVVVGGVTVTLHSAVIVGNTGVNGGVISLTMTVCVAVDILPLPSLNSHATTVVPCAVTGNGVNVVPVTVPTQLSIAVGAVGVTPHSLTSVGNDDGGTGGVTSLINTFCTAVDILPLPSLNVHVTTVIPCVVTGNIVVVVPNTGPAQLSVAIGVAGVAEHWSVTLGIAGATGFWLS